jgi:post-segregation antitoxin (ccd killing protein)
MNILLEGDELEKRARELGIDISGDTRTQSSSGRTPRAPDFELQRRIIEAERRNRESRLWVIAVISAIASVVSALTAFWAVVKK